MSTQVTGVREALNELRKIDREAYLAVRKDMRNAGWIAARSAVADAKRHLGQMQGFQHKGRTGVNAPGAINAAPKLDTRRPRFGAGNETWPLLKVVFSGAAASIGDMAGKRGAATPQGRALVSALGRSPSRFAWPAVERKEREIEAAMARALQELSNRTNRRLLTRK